ncbi:MAG: anti-sigma factor, partial [Actinobacteria bacterium]|nr:anti-sigma factor [Actinomycetota bacterium]
MTIHEEIQASYLEGDAEAEAHMHSCAECRERLPELDSIRDVLNDPSSWDEPSTGLEQRVVDAVTREAAAPLAAPISLDERRRRRNGLFSARVPVWAVAAAFVVVGAVVAGVAIGNGGAGGNGATFALVATPLAPHAHGSGGVKVEANGVRIQLDVSGLPRAPAGSYYQAWVKGDAGLVPIGTFHTG